MGVNPLVYPWGVVGEQIFAKQNNLPIKLSFAARKVKLTFPAYYGGRLRVSLFIEGTDLAGTIYQSAVYSGNVSTVDDMYACGSNSEDSPAGFVKVESDGRMVLVLSLNVAPVTNATDNSVEVETNMSAGNINQATIEATE